MVKDGEAGEDEVQPRREGARRRRPRRTSTPSTSCSSTRKPSCSRSEVEHERRPSDASTPAQRRRSPHGTAAGRNLPAGHRPRGRAGRVRRAQPALLRSRRSSLLVAVALALASRRAATTRCSAHGHDRGDRARSSVGTLADPDRLLPGRPAERGDRFSTTSVLLGSAGADRAGRPDLADAAAAPNGYVRDAAASLIIIALRAACSARSPR